MNIDFIIKDLEHTISYFQEPLTEMQIGRLYQAKETLSQIKMLSRDDVNKTPCKGNHYKNGVCSKYFGWCTEEQCDYWQKE